MITEAVFASVNVPVEKQDISTAQTSAGHHLASQPFLAGRAGPRESARETLVSIEPKLFQPVVGCFARDDHVVDVAFAQARWRDADEFAAFLKFLEVRCAAVTHPAAEPAYKLFHKSRQRPFVGNLPFDAFGHGLAALGAFLCIAVR